MTTKTIEKTIIEKKTVFVSADGKEWENEADCKEWEKGIECVARTGWNAIPKSSVSTAECGLDYGSDDDEAYIVIPRNHDDVVTIVNYVLVTTRDAINLSDADIGKAIILNFGYDHDWCGVTYVEKHMERLQKFFENQLAEISK